MGTQEGRGNRRLCEIASPHLETSRVGGKPGSVGSTRESFCVTSGRPLLCSHVKGCLGSFAQGLKSDPLILKQLSMRDKLCSSCAPRTTAVILLVVDFCNPKLNKTGERRQRLVLVGKAL